MIRLQHATLIILVLLIAAAASACGDAQPAAAGLEPISGIDDRKVEVVTTTNFVTDLVREVGGDRVAVDGLMGPGIDPHLYKATAGDVAAIGDADIVFYVGLELEGRMQDILEQAARRHPTVAVSDEVPRGKLLDKPGGSNGEHDPHIWFDPKMWASTPAVVADALGRIDPEHRDEYAENARRYEADIRAADELTERRLREIPPRARVLVTSHDAFRYFGRRYDIQVEAIQGTSTATESTTEDVDRIARLVAERRLRSVFVESSVPKQTIDAVLAAAEDAGWKAGIGGTLFSDAAGSEGAPEGTYLGMLDANVDRIVEGLA